MHELSLCESTLQIIKQQARAHNVKRVTAVWLEIGALSCVEESAFRFSFDLVCKGTVAEGCTLHVLHPPAKVWCWDCSHEVEISAHEQSCPKCGGHRLRVDSGDSIRIKELEVE